MVNSKPINIFKNKVGFTLIEVLIAIVLLAFISLYTFKMVDNSTDTKERVLAEDKALLQSLTAIGRLDSDVSQMYSPLYAFGKSTPTTDPNAVYQDSDTAKGSFDGRAKNGMLIPQFISEDKSSIVFLTSANRRKIADSKESRFTWVRYSMRRTEKSPNESEDKTNSKGDSELVRQTISTNIYTNELNWGEVKAQVLMTQIKSVQFSFWDEKTKKFLESLQDLNENKNSIRSIKMDLIWIDENNNEQKITKTYRILYPYFNTKLDDVGGAWGDSAPPNGLPDPNNPQGGSGVHF